MCQNGDLQHVFAIFECLLGPLVTKFFHILVDEFLGLDLSGITSKLDAGIAFRNKQNVRQISYHMYVSYLQNETRYQNFKYIFGISDKFYMR